MAVDFDKELTSLAAKVLRDALQVYDQSDVERWMAGYMSGFGVGNVTGVIPAVTSSFAATTSSFRAITEALPAATSAFAALGSGQAADAKVRLRNVFGLPDRLPGILLPPDDQLARLARSAPIMAMLAALAGWLGQDGRLVTAKDELSDADAADAARWLGVRPQYLTYLWDYALTSGWFKLDGEPGGGPTRAVIGRTAWRWADGDDSGALHAWAAVFAAVLARTLEVAADSDLDASRKLNFQGQGVVVAILLFMARRTGLSPAGIRDLIMDDAIGDRPLARARWAWESWVRGYRDPSRLLLGELAVLHAVTMPDSDDGMVGLTSLALWALRKQLRLDDIEVPLLSAASPQMAAANLVALADAVGEAEFEAATASWVAARGPDRAARELLAFAAFSGPESRLAAVNLVRQIGTDAHEAWRDAMQRPELRGYARIALSMLAADLPEGATPSVLNPDPDDLTWLATDLLALACGEEDPDSGKIEEQLAEAVPQGKESWIFGLMSQSSHPDIARVLTVLGRYHPDRRVAKEARRAARAAAKNRTVARADHVSARPAAR